MWRIAKRQKPQKKRFRGTPSAATFWVCGLLGPRNRVQIEVGLTAASFLASERPQFGRRSYPRVWPHLNPATWGGGPSSGWRQSLTPILVNSWGQAALPCAQRLGEVPQAQEKL